MIAIVRSGIRNRYLTILDSVSLPASIVLAKTIRDEGFECDPIYRRAGLVFEIAAIPLEVVSLSSVGLWRPAHG